MLQGIMCCSLSPRRSIPVFVLCMLLACYYYTKYSHLITVDIERSHGNGTRTDISITGQNTIVESPMNEALCAVTCQPSVPCEYPDEVDFRILVLTYNRPESLRECLNSIKALDTMGHSVSVHVWVDKSRLGSVDNATVAVAEAFRMSWTGGRACVHVQAAHAYIGRQWMNTWRPRADTEEIALILEDDVDISSHAYRYLYHVTRKYGKRDDVSGYTLQMHDVMFFGESCYRRMSGPAADTVFLYGVLGTWGFAPRPKAWRDFQDWFSAKDASLEPLVPGIVPTRWYKGLSSRHQEQSMWEMWHIYHSNVSNLSCVYCNLVANTGRQDVLLSVNRKEKGLHFSKKGTTSMRKNLMHAWSNCFVDFSRHIVKYNYDGMPSKSVI